MGIDPKKITQKKMQLFGFIGNVMISVGTIRLLVSMEGAIILMNFVILNTHMSYNAILRHPWIHKMRAVPSTYHQLIKYPIFERVKEISGE